MKQLELLLALEKADGISSAGRALGMTASATSHALRALETNIGVPLLDRNAPGVELTFAGKQILPHVRDVFSALNLVQSVARSGAKL